MKKTILFVVLTLSAQACLFGKKDDPETCRTNDECASKVCDLATYYCVTAAGADSGMPDATGPDIPIGLDGAGGSASDGGPADARTDQANPDGRLPDAAGTCGSSTDCVDPAKAFCVAGMCVGCQSAGTTACTAPTAVCDSTSGKCVACTEDRQCTTAVAPICDKAKNVCATCATDLQCQTKSVALPACRADGQCVQCTATTAATCIGGTPACDTTTNTCVQCTSSANCAGTTPLCGTAEKCQACAADTECATLNDPARTACATTGACVQCTATNATKCTGTTAVCNTTTNACVQCLTNATCSGTKPICATATNTCRACASASDCSGFAGHTACAASGSCVQCTDNSTCSGTTPICATGTNTCRKCSADSECSGAGPGVCLMDGHCATDAEAVYVGTTATATCSETNAGTAQAPVCSLQTGVTLAKKNSSTVVLLRGALAAASTNISAASPLTIAGKNSATLTPASALGADCLTFTSGEIYLRNLTIQGTASPASGMGINALPGTTLHMDTCAVINNPGGGILLNGSAFDIKNTTVSNNGSGSLGSATWGGILTNNPPSGGPTTLTNVTIQNNGQVGLVCSSGITITTSVLSTGNNSGSTKATDQIGTACGITSCASASTTCGTQSQPQ